jgi:hypothetical protein
VFDGKRRIGPGSLGEEDDRGWKEMIQSMREMRGETVRPFNFATPFHHRIGNQ